MCHSKAVDSKELAGAPEAEIEVTPEMIEAGVDVIIDYSFEDGICLTSFGNVVEDIYRVMRSTEQRSC
jgi:hypothetical protein